MKVLSLSFIIKDMSKVISLPRKGFIKNKREEDFRRRNNFK